MNERAARVAAPRVLSARRRRLAVALIGSVPLAACMGIDVGSVHRADPSASVAAERAIAFGRIRWVVDGRPIGYHLLNRPALQIFHRGRGRLMATPECDADGSFAWELPAGDYGVAVLHGGMGPAQQPHRLPQGALVFVNGIVDPGLEFRLAPGQRHYLGTLVVEVASRPPTGVLFGSERVFDRLLALRIVDERGHAGEAPALRRIQRSDIRHRAYGSPAD